MGTDVIDIEGGVNEVEEEVGREVTEVPVASMGRDGGEEQTKVSATETEDPWLLR